MTSLCLLASSDANLQILAHNFNLAPHAACIAET